MNGCRRSPHGYSFGERVLRCRIPTWATDHYFPFRAQWCILTSGLQISVMLIWKLFARGDTWDLLDDECGEE
jgi:hypothetical protein